MEMIKRILGVFAVAATAVMAFMFVPAAAYAVEGQEVSVVTPLTEGVSDDDTNNPSTGDADEGVLPEGDASVTDGPGLDVPADVPQDEPLNEDDIDVADDSGYMPGDLDDVIVDDTEGATEQEGDESDDSEEPTEEQPELIEVTAEAPTKTYEPCRPPMAEQRWVKISNTEGIQYFVNGEAVEYGLIPVGGYEATVTAVALEGYALVGESEWFIPFDFHECTGTDIVFPELPEPLPHPECVHACNGESDIVFPDFTKKEEATAVPAAVVTTTTEQPAQLAVTGFGDTTTSKFLIVVGVIAVTGGFFLLVLRREKKSLED
ncbi:LPXTG cell wall anchor domain-containing protein [Candidatus Saccharibacteria bacterium TM7i]|nr:LPXTG cell wall anchor domain-containing protein [Candidatus Saccharibacteria bacterium TM7i]